MRVVADREVCVGAGMCALTAPEAFDQSPEDGRVVVVAQPLTPEQEAAARAAVDACPAAALMLHEE